MKGNLKLTELLNQLPRRDPLMYDIINRLKSNLDELDAGIAGTAKAVTNLSTSVASGLDLYTVRKHIEFDV